MFKKIRDKWERCDKAEIFGVPAFFVFLYGLYCAAHQLLDYFKTMI